jgi:hypothetical protein
MQAQEELVNLKFINSENLIYPVCTTLIQKAKTIVNCIDVCSSGEYILIIIKCHISTEELDVFFKLVKAQESEIFDIINQENLSSNIIKKFILFADFAEYEELLNMLITYFAQHRINDL